MADRRITAVLSSSTPRARFSSEVVSTWEAFGALETEWNALAARCTSSPMARHAWLYAAALAFPHRRPAVFLVRDDHGRLRAAAPFAVRGWGPLERLEWLSHEMHEPQAMLYDDQPALGALWRAILSARRPVTARRLTLRGDEPDVLRVARFGLSRLRLGTTQTLAAPIGGDWGEFERKLSANARSEMRRKRRGLEKQGALRVQALSPAPEDVDGVMDLLIELEASGWKGRERSAISFRPALERFLRDYARRAASENAVRMFFLELDGRPVAGQFLVEQNRRLWQFKIAYDERWSAWSPGRLLMFDILRWANEQGLEAVEYLGHGGGWQSRWPAEPTEHATLRYYPVTPGAALALAADALGAIRRRLARSRAGESPKRRPHADASHDNVDPAGDTRPG